MAVENKQRKALSMAHHELLTISEFAKYARTTRDALLHYDRLGLLSPLLRGDNNYRRYSMTQVGAVNMIRTLQELGMSLMEIKDLQDRRTPPIIDESLARQISEIEVKIGEWERARKLLLTMRKVIQSASGIDEKKIYVQFVPAEPIILGSLNDYSEGRNDYDALVSFYQDILENHPDLDMNYPVWGAFSAERIRQGDCAWPDRYYFYHPEGRDSKPASLYVIAYARGGYGGHDDLFARLLDFIGKNRLEMCGDAYKEYPFNELCVSDESNYLIRVMIPVVCKE
jgi:DNA-binding transcriptional MerR regulator